jgi:hypothetical protein
MAMVQVLCFRLNALMVEWGCHLSWKTVTSSPGNRMVSAQPVGTSSHCMGTNMRNDFLSVIALLVAVVASGCVDTSDETSSDSAITTLVEDSQNAFPSITNNEEVDRLFNAQQQQYLIAHRAWQETRDARKAAERELAKIDEKIELMKEEKPSAPGFGRRDWETGDGNYKTNAELVDTDNVTVTLKKADGKVVTVPKEKLIHSSRLYVEKAFSELTEYRPKIEEWTFRYLEMKELRRTEASKISLSTEPEPQPPSREAIASKIAAESAAKLAAQTEVLNSRPAQPENLRIMSTDIYGTGTIEQWDKLFSLRNDADAVSKYSAQLLLTGNYFMFEEGDEVFVEKPGFIMTKVRRRGRLDAYWVSADFCILPPPPPTVAQSQSKTGGANTKDLSAAVLDVSIVTERNPIGRDVRFIKVRWKNTGTRPIRVIDGNIMINDNTGALPPKFEYTIFAVSESEPGIMPGETYIHTEGGFALPMGCTAKEARVEFTKVLEDSNF